MTFSKKQMFYAFACVVACQSMVTEPMMGAFGKIPKRQQLPAFLAGMAAATTVAYAGGKMMPVPAQSENKKQSAVAYMCKDVPVPVQSK